MNEIEFLIENKSVKLGLRLNTRDLLSLHPTPYSSARISIRKQSREALEKHSRLVEGLNQGNLENKVMQLMIPLEFPGGGWMADAFYSIFITFPHSADNLVSRVLQM